MKLASKVMGQAQNLWGKLADVQIQVGADIIGLSLKSAEQFSNWKYSQGSLGAESLFWETSVFAFNSFSW